MTEFAIQYVIGDATQPQGEGYKLITHICNDIGAWGQGFVLALSRRWPQPEAEYRAWHKSQTHFALGEIQLVEVAPDLSVANIIGQKGIWPLNGVPPIRYEAVRQGLKKVAEFALSKPASVHMPRMGAGLAGGKWPEIERIVEEELVGHAIPVTVYNLP
ncbi:MAG: macro domain-containing protein [Bacteroidia bacterium]|nr:macro domain-containing protein [Bacteroidia bacterium]